MKTKLLPYTALLLCLVSAYSFKSYANYPTFDQHAVLDGASYLSVPNSVSLNYNLVMSGVISIDAWVYPTSFANYPTIVGNDYNMSYWLGLNTAGNIRFYPGSGIYRESANPIPLNRWTHIAISYNYYKGQMKFFINNVLDRLVQDFTVPLGMGQSDFRIGADRLATGAPAYFFNGSIDEVRIWRTDIDFPSADGALYKIPQQYAGGKYGLFLVSAWRLNGNGADSVSNNNASNVGSVAFASTNNPPHYRRICAVLPNTSGQSHDYFIIPNSSSISLTGNYTIECWVNLASGGSTTYQTFINKGDIGATANVLSYWLGVNKQNGKLRFILCSSRDLFRNLWLTLPGIPGSCCCRPLESF